MPKQYLSEFFRHFLKNVLAILPALGFLGAMLWLAGQPWEVIAYALGLIALVGVAALLIGCHLVATGREVHIEDFWRIRTPLDFEPPAAPSWSTDLDFSSVQATREPRVSLPVAVFALAAAGFVTITTGPIGLMVLMIVGYVSHKIFVGRKRTALSSHSLSVTQDVLAELDDEGRVLSTIDLTRPISYVYLDQEEGEAIYRVREGRERVEFLSSTPGADVVASRMLGAEWPPRDNARLSA